MGKKWVPTAGSICAFALPEELAPSCLRHCDYVVSVMWLLLGSDLDIRVVLLRRGRRRRATDRNASRDPRPALAPTRPSVRLPILNGYTRGADRDHRWMPGWRCDVSAEAGRALLRPSTFRPWPVAPRARSRLRCGDGRASSAAGWLQAELLAKARVRACPRRRSTPCPLATGPDFVIRLARPAPNFAR